MNAYSLQMPTLRQKKLAVQQLIMSTSFRISLVVITAVLSVLFVVQTNGISTKGYEISDLERKLATLQHETRSIDVDIAKSSSMQSIQDRLSGLNMVDGSEMVYITVPGKTVAKR